MLSFGNHTPCDDCRLYDRLCNLQENESVRSGFSVSERVGMCPNRFVQIPVKAVKTGVAVMMITLSLISLDCLLFISYLVTKTVIERKSLKPSSPLGTNTMKTNIFQTFDSTAIMLKLYISANRRYEM